MTERRSRGLEDPPEHRGKPWRVAYYGRAEVGRNALASGLGVARGLLTDIAFLGSHSRLDQPAPHGRSGRRRIKAAPRQERVRTVPPCSRIGDPSQRSALARQEALGGRIVGRHATLVALDTPPLTRR